MMEIRDFLEDYRRTWESATDVTPLGRFVHVPYIAVGADGVATLIASDVEVARFNQTRMDLFRADKIERWYLRGCDPLMLGTQSVLVAVNWEGQRSDGTVARAWRHYYNIVRTADGPKILVSTFSAGS